jgi:replicative DNA helicase
MGYQDDDIGGCMTNVDELFDADAELFILAGIFKNPTEIYRLSDLKPMMFSSKNYQIVYKTMLEIVDAGQEPDYSLTKTWLKSMGKLDEAGGDVTLNYIREHDVRPDSIVSYSNAVINASKAKGLLILGNKIPSIIENRESVDSALSAVREELDKLTMSTTTGEVYQFGDYVKQGMDRLTKKIFGEELAGISTGYKSIDANTAGFTAGDMWFIAARPGHGKTSLALNMALELGMKGIPSIFFELEMNKQALFERTLAIKTGIPVIEIRLGKDLSPIQIEMIHNAAEEIRHYPIFVDTNFSGDITYVSNMIRKYVRIHNIKVAFLDYIQLLAERGSDATHELGKISRELKLISGELNITSVILSQVNRNSESRDDKRPMLSDIRQSGNIEEDADLVGVLFRESMYAEKAVAAVEKLEFIIRKQRNGPVGDILMAFDKQSNRVLEYNGE